MGKYFWGNWGKLRGKNDARKKWGKEEKNEENKEKMRKRPKKISKIKKKIGKNEEIFVQMRKFR